MSSRSFRRIAGILVLAAFLAPAAGLHATFGAPEGDTGASMDSNG
jgi:hypothetical protein